MNLVLLREEDFTAPGRVRIHGRRERHVLEVHRAVVGDDLAVGLLG
ncbi:MAG: 16S rRNA (uracil(1498)-N(3))-methyltransferase, partial [Holophaga sp.]|nr:16S rRNA (uracil(1498)-N(3))-methyltransferase [Holophaga sp.]